MNYHPDIEVLLKYANGQLPASVAVAVGIHQKECKICQARIADIESIGGDAIEVVNVTQQQNTLTPKSTTAFDQLMADINAISQEEAIDDLAECAVAEVDKPILSQLSRRDYSKFNWKRVTPWIKKAIVPLNDEGYQVELLKFSPNAKIPKHTHQGEEITVVLEGNFSDASGTYNKGEFITQDSANEHQPVAGNNGCVCLAITSAPLKFTGPLGPVLNWMTQ